MSEPESPRRSRKARALGLLVLVALGYFAGVGVAALFGLEDPWTRGVLGAGPVLGAAAVEALRRQTPNG
ncbi:hypothetical protein ABZ342_14610 [Amycolatopsis sp. NPDC005961]|uniref:hypothetical protein n=1 Tax=Amycolatopsis sp. NPDC005961 TaxID=3156720 RepID=UPI0033CD8092